MNHMQLKLIFYNEDLPKPLGQVCEWPVLLVGTLSEQTEEERKNLPSVNERQITLMPLLCAN